MRSSRGAYLPRVRDNGKQRCSIQAWAWRFAILAVTTSLSVLSIQFLLPNTPPILQLGSTQSGGLYLKESANESPASQSKVGSGEGAQGTETRSSSSLEDGTSASVEVPASTGESTNQEGQPSLPGRTLNGVHQENAELKPSESERKTGGEARVEKGAEKEASANAEKDEDAAWAEEDKRRQDEEAEAAKVAAQLTTIEEYEILDPNAQRGRGLVDRCPCKTGQLDRDISFKQLSTLLIHSNFRYVSKTAPQPEVDCEGLPCPIFGKCNSAKSVVAAVCHNPSIKDKARLADPPVKAFPPDSKEAKERDLEVDFQGDVFVLENVYINKQGEVFNTTHHLARGGCYYLDDFEYKATTKVTRFKYLVNLVNWNSANLFHLVTELLPEVLLTAKVLRRFEGIPVAFRATQDEGMVRAWFALVGWPLPRLTLHFLEHEDLFLAEKLITPAHTQCAHLAPSLLEHFRTTYLRLPAGAAGGKDKPSPKMLTSGLVLFGRRPKGKTRYIPQEEEILQGLEDLYTKERVRSFYGTLSIPETQALLSGVVLYVGGHGAGMTNMVFMPPGGSVLEIRPNGTYNNCYHHLASYSHLAYHLVMGTGSHETDLHVNASIVLQMAAEILPPSTAGTGPKSAS